MRILGGATLAYLIACTAATVLGGLAGLLVTIAVLAPVSAFGVVVLCAQERKYDREDRYLIPGRRPEYIDSTSTIHH